MAVGYLGNTITLLALIPAIGIVVDGAIIVVENVERVMHDKPDPAPKKATSKAMGDIVLPIFIPVAALPGSSGVLYREFAITIPAVTLLSMVSALTLSPALCAMLLKIGKLPEVM